MKKLLFFLIFALFNTSASGSIQKFPEHSCSSFDLSLRIVDLSYCPVKNNIENIYFLGLSSQTIVVTESDKELTIGLNPPDISISNLHHKFNLSVNGFFFALYENSPKIINLKKIKQAFDIDKDNPLAIYRKNDVYAFVIMGTNNKYDRIYINKKNSDIIYQITGEFDNNELLKILARIEY